MAGINTTQLNSINLGIGILIQLVGQGAALTTEVIAAAKALWTVIHAPSMTPEQMAAAWAVVVSQDEIGLALAKAQSGQV
jgi:hypothetical protein